MIDTNKYYVPEVEEFHVGFRFCTVKPDQDPRPMEMDYKTYMNWGRTNTLFNGIKDGAILVKYLDRDDIEELGWGRDVDNDRDKYEAWYLELKDGAWSGFTLLKSTETTEIVIQQIHNKFKNFDSVRFWGDTRNFSELRRIMKQLQIQ